MSFSDSPLSTDEPLDLTDMTSAESRLAASSKLDDVRVDDSKNRLTTVRPRRVGSFFISRSSDRSKLPAVASSRVDVLAREVGDRDQVAARRWVGRRQQVVAHQLNRHAASLLGDQHDPVDLVDLDELHLDALGAGGGQVLADVVGADRQLAVAAVGDDGELDARGAAVVEERLDRGADRAAGVEDVVDEDARAPLEGEVELRLADERLRVQGRLAAAHVDVVAVEGDVERPEVDLDAAELLDQPAEAVRERDAARVDADERDATRAPRSPR